MPGRGASRLACALLLAAGMLLRAAAARAHGTYPDAQRILLPADRPEQIIVATNFGLISSEDSGKTWVFSCENGISVNAGPYLLGPPPSKRILAITTSGAGFIYSDDDSCTWSAARGPVAELLPYGFSVDPSDGQRVYVVGAPLNDLRSGDGIYVSDDGGVSFGAPLFTAPSGSALLTVLAAAGQPGTVFAAMYSADQHPILLSSHDSGQHWDPPVDLTDSIGQNPFELLWIDPADPNRIYVRILGASAEILGISRDGGKSFVPSVSIAGKLSAFLKLASGTILVGGTAGVTPVGYRSTDDAQTFQPWPQAPRVHALAERDGKLYVGGSNYDDGYVIAESDDEGITLTPLTGFGQVAAVKSCVASVCAEACAYYAGTGLWPQAVCGGDPAESGPDGATGADDASRDADGAPAADAAAESSGGGSRGGCGCDLGQGPLEEPWPALLFCLFFAAIWVRGRRSFY